jgi:hypothetical protein
MPAARISTVQSFAFKLCPPVLDAGLYALKSEKLKWRKMFREAGKSMKARELAAS